MQLMGAEIVIRCLQEEGVEHVFGYPGGAVLHIYDELFKQNKVKHVLTRHEQGAVHAAEHAMIGLLPLFTICDRWDVGGVSMAIHPETEEPTIFIYDGYPGGAGIAELAFADVARHVRETLDLVRACPCDDGCPSCVQSPKCGNWNEYLDKGAAITLLELLAG